MQLITDTTFLGADDAAFPPAQPVPPFLTASAVAEAAALLSKSETVHQPPRTLNMQAGPTLSSKPAASMAPTQSVCTFPAGLSFEGEASFPCDFAVMGSINGKVALSGQSKLVIAAGGKVDGEIVAKCISIDGEANGKIDASGGLVSFGENARCTGSIQYGRMSMAEGAEVEATMKKVA